MLPSAERLRRSGLFQRVYNGRKSVSTPLLTLYVLEREPRSQPRLPLAGFVIGKKVEAKATMRNRAKRRVREAYRLLCKATPENEADREQQTKLLKVLRQWYAVVWVLKSEVLSVDFQEIRQSVNECILTAQVKHGRSRRDKQ